jgi:predicted lactoylglutathione lyase/uncharacterized protein YndB with AHSA1/START domain
MADNRSRKLFVNVAVRDLKASMDFFSRLGFEFNPQFTDDKAACMIVSEEAFVMLLTEPFFKTFTKRGVCDTSKATEGLFALSCSSRAEVDAMVAEAIAGGGEAATDPVDHGFMYFRSFYDLDGHQWEVIWMDPKAVQPSASKVGATTFTMPTDREIMATRVVDAPRRLVFEASTGPEHLPHWMLGPEGWTMPVCEIDLRPGGAWHYRWRRPDGAEMEMRGVFREIAPPERLVQTETWCGGTWPETLNTLILTEEDGKTTMACTVLYPSKEARDAALGTGMKEGWAASYDRLDEYLRTMAESGRAEAEELRPPPSAPASP